MFLGSKKGCQPNTSSNAEKEMGMNFHLQIRAHPIVTPVCGRMFPVK